MTNKPRWAKLQTTDIQRIQGISKTQTQNIRTVSLSCWWPCFWIWIMQSYWIYSEFLMTGETLYYPTTSLTDRWDPLLSYHLSDWQVRPFTILSPQWLTGETLYYLTTSVTDRWDPLLSYHLSTLTGETLYYLTTSVTDRWNPLLSYHLSDWQVRPFTIIPPQWLTGETLYHPTILVHWLVTVYYPTISVTDLWLFTILLPQCPGHRVFFDRSACANLFIDKAWTLKLVHGCRNYYGQINIMIKQSSYHLKYLTICEWHLRNPKAASLAMDSKTTTLSDDQKLRTEQLHAQIRVWQPLWLMTRNRTKQLHAQIKDLKGTWSRTEQLHAQIKD